MGIRQLEAGILKELREVTGKKKLRQKDIMQWSTGEVKVEPGEAMVHLPELNINVAYLVQTE